MKQKLFFAALLTGLSFFVSAFEVSAANEVFSIGRDDANYSEFAHAGNYDLAAKNLSGKTAFQVGKSDSKTAWPFIHPGPIDSWAGRKSHTYTIEFDLPSQASEATAYELFIKGWGQQGSPPVLKIDLNGKTTRLATNKDAQGDAVLTDPKAAKPGSYSAKFPPSAIQPTKNVLTITTESGSWFIYDFLQLRARTGKIEAIAIHAQRGIYKHTTSEGVVPARKVKIDYAGECLDKPASLEIEYRSENADTKKIRLALNPEKHFDGVEVLLSRSEADCAEPLTVNATLDIQNRSIRAEEAKLPEERKWEIHLIHQTHLDIGYTHTQVDVLERQVQSLHDSIKYIEETKNYPEEAKFRFHPEGMWAVEEFFKRATDEEKAAFIAAAKTRDIHLDVMYAQAMTGMYSDEELFELMGSAIRFGREHDIVVDSAMQTDVPGYTWGLVPVLAKCGIKYMTMGPNAGHRVGRVYHWGEKPFYWKSPSGKEKVLCYLLDTGYHQFHGKPLGHRLTEAEIFNILEGRDWLARSDDARKFPYDMFPLRYGIEGDNGRPNRVLSDVVKEWNEKFYYPKLIISQNGKFMQDFEKRYGKELPTVHGDYTPYWEDGAASTSEATSINRRAKALLIQAEIEWAKSKPQEYPANVEAFDAAWTDLIMYDEHTWGAHNSISQPDSDFVKQQDDYKQEYAKRGARRVAALLPQSWFPKPKTSVPGSIKANAGEGTLENETVSLKIDKATGAIVSLKMKGIENDLVNPGDDGNAGLNDYLYIIGRNAAENRERYNDGVKITATEKGDGLVVTSPVPNCDTLTRTITLQPGSEVIQIKNVMQKRMERRPEGVFFGFPFNVPGGVWRVDTPWAMVQVEKDQLPGANRNFYCVQRFCNISNDKYGIDWVTVDAPMAQFSPILFTNAWDRELKQWREHIDPTGTIYSWICNNHWETNYKAGQDGILRFAYLIRPYSGEYDAVRSQRFVFGDEILEAVSDMVRLDNENVLVTRLKPAREAKDDAKSDSPYAQGVMLRLYNPTSEPQRVSLKFSVPQSDRKSYEADIYLSNPWEDRIKKLSGAITIDPFDMIMLRVE